MNILINIMEMFRITVLSKLEAEQAESELERERFHEQIKSLEK